jgi:hypothetical protein
MIRSSRRLAIVLGPLVVLAAAASGAEERPIGLVVGMRGHVVAQADGAEARRLDCGQPIYAGERLAAGEASRISVLIGDVYVQLFVDSQADFATTPDGTPDLFLVSGRMRVVDPRTDAASPAVRVATPRARTEFARNDIDAYVLGPAGATNSMLCSERTAIDVERVDLDADPWHTPTGLCTIVSMDKPTFQARVPSERIGLREAPDCTLDLAAGDRFDSIDVAAPRALPGMGLPDIGPFDPRGACDVPGSGCGGVSVPSDLLPDPTPNPLPGGLPDGDSD